MLLSMANRSASVDLGVDYPAVPVIIDCVRVPYAGLKRAHSQVYSDQVNRRRR
jgi:hypothetical protein